MNVFIPSPLRSYTQGASYVDAQGATLGGLLDDLDHRFPGFRFRIVDERARVRQHIKLFVDEEVVEDLGRQLGGARAVHVICALSGG